MTLGSVSKVVGSWEKVRENGGSVGKSPTESYSYRQDVMVGDVFARPVVEVLQALNP